MPQDQNLRTHLALIVAMLIWGSTFMVMKVVITDVSPLMVVFLRMLIGALVFILLWKWIKKGIRYQTGDWKYLILMALFEPCLYFLFEGLALKYTSAGQAGMITSILPLMVALAAFLFLKETTTWRQILGFIIAISGVISMTLGSEVNDKASNPLLGNFLEFLAMLSAVGYTLLIRHLSSRYASLFLTAMQSFIGTLFFLPLVLLNDSSLEISLLNWGLLAYLGIVVTLGGYGLFNYALTHVKATTAVAYVNLIPAISLIYAMIFLGERLTQSQWIAVVVIFIGVLLSKEKKPHTPT